MQFSAPIHLELPAIAVIDVLDQHRNFGAGVEVFPREQGSGLVRMQPDIHFISVPISLLHLTNRRRGADDNFVRVQNGVCKAIKPHLERGLVVVEPNNSCRTRKQSLHDGSREAEVQDVDGVALGSKRHLHVKVFGRLHLPVVHRDVFSLVAELEPCGKGGAKPVGAVCVIDD